MRSNHLGPKTVLWFLNNKNRTPAGWKGVSVPTEPIRVIVVIVVNPREVFKVLSGKNFAHSLGRCLA